MSEYRKYVIFFKNEKGSLIRLELKAKSVQLGIDYIESSRDKIQAASGHLIKKNTPILIRVK